MDTLKNLIIAFGSILIVLALVAVGIISWAAFGGSGDDKNAQIFEEIIGESELARTTAQANAETLKDLDRKMDALSFQIDSISSDLLVNAAGAPGNGMADGESLVSLGGNGNVESAGNNVINGAKAANQPEQKPEPGLVAAAPVAVDNSKLEAKVDDVARSLDLAQRRVIEINNRVKSLQQQYSTMSKSVKQVEKGWLEQKLEAQKQLQEQEKVAAEQAQKAEEAKEEKPKPYQYNAPSSFNYEATQEGNSYP